MYPLMLHRTRWNFGGIALRCPILIIYFLAAEVLLFRFQRRLRAALSNCVESQ